MRASGEGTHRAPRIAWWRAMFDDPAEREAAYTLVNTAGLPVLAWPHPTVNVLGVNVGAVWLRELIADVEHALATRLRLSLIFADPPCLVASARNPALGARMNTFDHLLPDGAGVRVAARVLGRRIPQNLSGDALAGPLFELLARRRSRVFLLASTPGTAEAATRRLTAAYPDLVVCGAMDAPQDTDERRPGRYSQDAFRKMIETVNDARPDFLLASLPTPSQQRFVIDNMQRLQVPVVLAGGSWLDRLAEPLASPAWAQLPGLRWAYRRLRPGLRAYRRRFALGEFGFRVLRQKLTRDRSARDSVAR